MIGKGLSEFGICRYLTGIKVFIIISIFERGDLVSFAISRPARYITAHACRPYKTHSFRQQYFLLLTRKYVFFFSFSLFFPLFYNLFIHFFYNCHGYSFLFYMVNFYKR